MSSDLTDYDSTEDGGGLVSKDESVIGRSQPSALVSPGDNKTPHGTLGNEEGSSGKDEETETSKEGRDEKDAKAIGNESDPLLEPAEESEQQIVPSDQHLTDADGGHRNRKLLTLRNSPRKRQSRTSSQHSDNTPASTRDQTCSDFAEETHDGPSKSVSDTSGRNPAKRKRIEEPPTKSFKPSRDNSEE